MTDTQAAIQSKALLQSILDQENAKFRECYLWLEKNMSPKFFQEVTPENIILIVHNMMGLHLQDFFSTINLKRAAIVICLDTPSADLTVLKNYAYNGIKNYQTYVSLEPFQNSSEKIRIATIYFTETIDTESDKFPKEHIEQLKGIIKEKMPELSEEEFNNLIRGINTRFLRSLSTHRLVLALSMFLRAKTRDNCQYETIYNEDWKETGAPSMQIVLAWRNCPKHNFLYRLARTIYRHKLVITNVNATYINPYGSRNTLILAIGLNGRDGKAAWEATNIPDFLREFVTVKYFASFDMIDKMLVSKEVVSGNMANFLRASVNFVHQALVHLDPNLYTVENIEEAFCRHPELTSQICAAFKYKFDPQHNNYQSYLELHDKTKEEIEKLDTGQPENDIRRKNVLYQCLNFIQHTLKTNFFRHNFTAISFRLDPKYLDEIPFNRAEKFPELPYAIYFIKGMHFFGFHIRFKDLSRGGLRTVYPKQTEYVPLERNNIFTECYNLAYTQQYKNKDIPEGGAKGVLFLQPYSRLESETLILKRELENAAVPPAEIEKKLSTFKEEQSIEYLYQAQRSYIESLVTIVNCEPDGSLRAKYIIDYWKRPEYLYLGPDENMHDSMIQWIAWFSTNYNYKPKSTFISGKPDVGINHKEYGVTSLGLNVYMEAVLRYLGIEPTKDSFTVKISGGPDGDVAGNQIKNLYTFFHKTAKILAITDVSGTIHDPQGLDLDTLHSLFKQSNPIKHYPPEKLHEGGFLVDKFTKRTISTYALQTLCWRMQDGQLIEDWLSGNEMNHLVKNNVHETVADIFIPGGGRPRTLNASNVTDFLDIHGVPTAKAIVEGANLYLTQEAREFLEQRGCLIIKDSSANKTGVICSSFEVLCGLTLGDKKFLENKSILVPEILSRLKECASNEAQLLLSTHTQTGEELTRISDKISQHINLFTYQLLDYLDTVPLSNDPHDPLVRTFLEYCPPTLRKDFEKELLKEIPEHHKKAIIACSIAAKLVYKKGLNWFPTIVDILPIVLGKKLD